MLKVVTLWLLCAILAHGVNVSTKPVMKIRAAVKARQQTDNLSPAEPATPMVAAQLQETKKETHENKNVMEMDDDTPVVGDASDGDSQVEVAPEDSNVPVYPEPTTSDSSQTSSDSDVSSSFKSKGEDPVDSAVVHLHQDDSNYVNPEDETTVTASSPQSDSNDYAPVKTTHNAIAPGSDTVFVPPSPTEDTVPQSQIVPRSLASAIARSSGQTATTLGAPTPTSTPDASANNNNNYPASAATTPYPTSATPPTPMTAADQQQQQQQVAQSQSQSQSNPPTGQTTSPDAEVAPVFQLPSAADVQAAEAQAQAQAQATEAQAASSSQQQATPTPTSTSTSTPAPDASSTIPPTTTPATAAPATPGASYSAPMVSPPATTTTSDSTPPAAGSPTDSNAPMKILVSDAPSSTPSTSSSTPSAATPSSSTPPTPTAAGPVQQPPSSAPADAPAAAAPADAPAAPAAGPTQDTQAFMAQKLAQAMALEKQRESFEQALHSANPEAARAYFQWQERQTQQAQQEQLQTQMELRNQVLALQDQLFQTQQLLKTNIAVKTAAPAPAPAVATPPPAPMTVPMRFPSAASGITSRTLSEISVAVSNDTTVAPQTFFHNSKLIQPPSDTVSIFFFADAYCSGDFTWYAPPQSAMLWSVGSWMSQDHATGSAQSLMLCHNLPGVYQRIFQATVWRAVNFDSDRVDHIFYVYPGQCTCSGQLGTTAFPDAKQVGSWKLAQI